MFPIGIMYYFGVNLDEKFSTPDFWPKRDQTHTIPFEKEEIGEELERLKQRRLAARARRMQLEGRDEQFNNDPAALQTPSPLLQTLGHTERQDVHTSDESKGPGKSWFRWS